MHFRERGASVQLVRTTYDPDTKRPKQEIVGRMRRLKMELTDDIAALLTTEEKGELASYIERVSSLDLLGRKLGAHTLLRTVTAAIEYAREVEDVAEQDLLRDEFAQAIIALRRATAVVAREAAEDETGEN
jgi:hypothetical protein